MTKHTTGRGRPSIPAADVVDVSVNETAIADASAAATQVGMQLQAIDSAFADGAPYDVHRVVTEARYWMSQSADALLQAGKRLILLKEHEGHGQFQSICEERLGISPRSARVMMQAAAKYLAPSIQVGSHAQDLLGLGRAKLLELVAEPDEELAELANGGTLAGATLDEIETMTTRELRQLIRRERGEARKVIDAKDKVIERKASAVTELEEQLARRESAPADERAAEQMTTLRDATLVAMGSLDTLLMAIDMAMTDAALDSVALSARQTLDYVAQRLVDAAEQRGLAISLPGADDARVVPASMAGFETTRLAASGQGTGAGAWPMPTPRARTAALPADDDLPPVPGSRRGSDAANG